MSDIDRERLARVLGMLGSAHVGEVLAAARQAERMRRSAGVTWADLLAPAALSAAALPRLSAAEALGVCWRARDRLTRWECGFVAGLAARRRPLTPRQAAVLRSIVVRLAAEAAQ